MKRALLLLVLLYGCGGPTASTPITMPTPAPVKVDVRDGWTGATIAPGEAPNVGSLVVPLQVTMGSAVTVSAPGYLTRAQILSGPVFLWPQDEAYVRQLVYGESVGGLLTKWVRGFTISAPGFEDIAGQVAAEATRVTGLPVTLATPGDVTVTMDESDPYWSGDGRGSIAYSQITMQGHQIISSKIVFRNRSVARTDVLLHEMGHSIGLSHTGNPDVMAPNSGARLTAFSERETIALKMMYSRRSAGNAPPDREGVAGSDMRVRTVVVE